MPDIGGMDMQGGVETGKGRGREFTDSGNAIKQRCCAGPNCRMDQVREIKVRLELEEVGYRIWSPLGFHGRWGGKVFCPMLESCDVHWVVGPFQLVDEVPSSDASIVVFYGARGVGSRKGGKEG